MLLIIFALILLALLTSSTLLINDWLHEDQYQLLEELQPISLIGVTIGNAKEKHLIIYRHQKHSAIAQTQIFCEQHRLANESCAVIYQSLRYEFLSSTRFRGNADVITNGELYLWSWLLSIFNNQSMAAAGTGGGAAAAAAPAESSRNPVTIVDAGCREDSYYFRTANKSFHFHLFEPNPLFARTVQQTVDVGGYSNVRVNNFGLGNSNTMMAYYETAQSFVDRGMEVDILTQATTATIAAVTATSIATSAQGTAASAQSTAASSHGTAGGLFYFRVMPLSLYMDYHLIESIDFLKIDTEGFEYDILQGLGSKLKQVKHLQFEYGGTYKDRGVTLQMVVDTILAAGDYHVFLIGSFGLYPINYHRINEVDYWCSNYFATRCIEDVQGIIRNYEDELIAFDATAEEYLMIN